VKRILAHRRALLVAAGLLALGGAAVAWLARPVGGGCGSSEDVALAQMIRAAQEAHRAEALHYLDVSTSDTPYPGPAGDVKRAFANPEHPDFPRWDALRINPDGPVRCGYTVRAGAAGQPLPEGFRGAVSRPKGRDQPWYVLHAVCAGAAGKRGFWMASWTTDRWAEASASTR
jgi:hypothetical protein